MSIGTFMGLVVLGSILAVGCAALECTSGRLNKLVVSLLVLFMLALGIYLLSLDDVADAIAASNELTRPA
ncbi:hypothetical protein J7E62_10585 [Variovorax paradoxus]|nr:hypothetical protein [Variovorax paradoxus]